MGLGAWFYEKLGNYLTKERPHKRGYLCDFGRICHEVKPADVLLIEGQSRVSSIIQKITLSPWSHAALYIGRLHDIDDVKLREKIQRHYQGRPSDQLLIESIVGKGTVVTSIKHYSDDHIRICRPTGLSYQDTQKVIQYAAKYLGVNYSIRHFIDLGRFILRSHLLPGRWFSSLFVFQPGQVSEDICSSIIATAFGSISFPILPLVREEEHNKYSLIRRNPRLFTPSDFDYSPYFDIIKYPIFAFGEKAQYRSLPWVDNAYSNDEKGIFQLNPTEKNTKPVPPKKTPEK